MRIIYFLFSLLLFLNCSERTQEIIENLDNNEPQFLLEKIALNVNDSEFTGQHIKEYEYNSFNNPVFLYEYNSNSNPSSASLIFNYDSSQQLTDIIKPFEYYENNVLQIGYTKFSFTQFNNSIAIIQAQDFDSNDNLISNSITSNIEVYFEEYLIKGYSYSSVSQNFDLSLEHDSEGKITQFSFTSNSGTTNYSISSFIAEWSDNLYPDNFGPIELQFMLELIHYFFPKHYTSIKNPTIFTDTNVQYFYSADGTVSDQIIECSGPSCYTPNHYSKNFIPAN